MNELIIVNLSNGNIVTKQAQMANSWSKRFVGLLMHKHLLNGEGMLLQPCQSIHTLGMRFSIDVVFLDKQFRITKLTRALKPYRFSLSTKGTHSVLELPTGTIDKSGLKTGDRLLVA